MEACVDKEGLGAGRRVFLAGCRVNALSGPPVRDRSALGIRRPDYRERMVEILRYAAFSSAREGGNPAGVVLDATGMDDSAMQRIAADIDFTETAFVTGSTDDGAMSVRFFSPVAEVPFCGHATIATAVALVERGRSETDGTIRFSTSVGPIAIMVSHDGTGVRGAFTSIRPSITELPARDLAAILHLLGLQPGALDPDLPPRIAHAGNPHPIIVIADRAVFDEFHFDPDAARALMDDRGWPATITVVHRAASDRFIARNLFPVGRITEDPATGSAAAALGAYLRELDTVPVPGRITVDQGAHVGRPGELTVDIPSNGGIVVSGYAVSMEWAEPRGVSEEEQAHTLRATLRGSLHGPFDHRGRPRDRSTECDLGAG